MVISATGVVLAGAILALLNVTGVALVYLGWRHRRAAAAAAEAARRGEALLGSAPMQSMLVRVDGQVEMSARLAGWLGLVRPARFLAELSQADGGMTAEDLAALTRDIAAAGRAARSFSRAVRPIGGANTLLLQGQRAAAGAGPHGSVVVWAFDATESETALARVGGEAEGLREAFAALSGLIEAAPLPMWYRDGELKLGLVNSAYVMAVEGKDAADTVARGLELVEATGAGGPLAGATVARDSGKPHEQAVPATIGGERRMLRVVDVPLPTGGVAGFALDMEELEQARSGAKRFADAQRAMLDRLSAAVAQFGPDRCLVFCNQPFRRMFAMRSEWIADRPEFDRMVERMREASRLPEVRDFPAWRAERRDWFTAPEAVEENWHLPAGAHLHLVAQPLPDGGLLLVFEDRTEQVQLASARDTLLRVRTATFDNLFEALGVFSADGRLQLWNNRFRALWGFEEEFLSGHPRVDAIAEAVAERLANPTRAGVVAELVRSATHDRQQRGGRVAFADGRHFEFATVPLPDGNALFTMLDISDSRRIEQALRDRNDALEAADRVKTRFVERVSYELRTPLTTISGFAEMLNAGFAGRLSAEADGYVEAILTSAERLGVMIDDVLDLTAGNVDGAPLERGDVDLAEVARAAAETVRPTAKRHKLDFAVEVLRTVGRMTGDARRLKEVIEHLLRHAVALTPEGGRVLLHADGNAARARIVVSDNGQGLDEAGAAHAFDRFSEHGPSGGGERALGLGLPLAKQFVEAHGGTVALVSEPGQGTLVTVELPRR